VPRYQVQVLFGLRWPFHFGWEMKIDDSSDWGWLKWYGVDLGFLVLSVACIGNSERFFRPQEVGSV